MSLTVALAGQALWAQSPTATGKRELVDSIGMALVLVAPGEFQMGGQESAEELVRVFAD